MNENGVKSVSNPSSEPVVDGGLNAVVAEQNTEAGASVAVKAKKPRVAAKKKTAKPVGVNGKAEPSHLVRPLVSPIAGGVGRTEQVYDPEAERKALGSFAEGGDDYDLNDPRWPRLLRLREYEATVARTQSVNKLRQQADPLITDAEAAQMGKFGALESSEDDYIEIHTKEAFRLFIGRLAEDEDQRRGAISGRKVASALRFLWLLSSNDNPYAEWALLQVEHKSDELRQLLGAVCRKYEKEMKELKNRGLSYSVMQAQRTQRLALGFRSPYGYLIAELIVDFDYSVRLIKTMVAKNRLSRLEGRSKVFELFRVVRSLFERLVPFQRMLQRPELLSLGRQDWIGQDVVGKQRVQLVLSVLGECPRAVFVGELIPRHTRRNGDRLSAAEIEVLKTVHLDGSDADITAVSSQENGLV